MSDHLLAVIEFSSDCGQAVQYVGGQGTGAFKRRRVAHAAVRGAFPLHYFGFPACARRLPRTA
jgi:hypothetical protein